VKSKEESCIRINIRELDGVLSTKYLFYIHLANSLYYTKFSLSWRTCSMTLLFYNLLQSSMWYIIIWQWPVTVCDIMLTFNPKSKNKKYIKMKNEKK